MKTLATAACLFLLSAASLLADDIPLGLSSAANMDFKDELAGDGRGGWSDQGPENDLRSFPLGRKEFEGVTFNILNPAQHAGRAILSFRHKSFPAGLTKAGLDLSAQKPRGSNLYLLHTTCWNSAPAGAVIGTIKIRFDDGGAVVKEVRSRTDVADWWGAGNLPNGRVVVSQQNGSSTVGVYLSRFEFASEAKRVVGVDFKTTEQALWIVVAATLSSKKIPLNMGKIKYEAGPEWRPVDMADIQVKPGTALDLSGIVEAGPAGRHGRLGVGSTGQLVFADSPDVPRRFRGSNSFWTLKKLDGGRPSEQVRQRMTKFSELFHRGGYDLIRLLPMDAYLMDGAKVDAEYNPEKLDQVDWLLAQLKENGVYTYLTIAAYRLGRADGGKGWREVMSVKAKMYLGDPESRARWRACAANMLNHVNPYTGVAWKDEPAIAVVEPYNEQEFGLFMFDRLDDETRVRFKQKWGEWLKAKFGTLEALVAQCRGDAVAKKLTTLDSVELPGGSGGFLGNEFNIFRRNLSAECLTWYRTVLREIGYPGLISQYNMSKGLLYASARAGGCEVVSNDGYFAHPSDVTRVGSQCSQSSSVGQGADYWRGIASMRLAGRPFIVNEHKHAYWNPYRHENALVFPAYSALQAFGAIMDHCDPALLEAEANFDFITSYDPVAIANEFVGGCLFRRGDVRPATKEVLLKIPRDYASPC